VGHLHWTILPQPRRPVGVAAYPLDRPFGRRAARGEGPNIRATATWGPDARIVAETFHRAMQGSQDSIVRDPGWRPTLGPNNQTFRMVDLLLFTLQGQAVKLNSLGN